MRRLRDVEARASSRASGDAVQAPRAWFGTLAFWPVSKRRLVARTVTRLSAAGVRFDHLPPAKQAAELQREAGKLLTNFLKFLRKGRKNEGIAPMRVRYLVSAEPQHDGITKFRVLLSEVSEAPTGSIRGLQAAWRHGASTWRRVSDETAAYYAARYLGKAGARVRASRAFSVRDGLEQ